MDDALSKRKQQRLNRLRGMSTSIGKAAPAPFPSPSSPPKVLSVVLGKDIKTGQEVRLEQKQRLRGFYGIGIPGSGKTTLLINMILQDIVQGMGVCFLDVHGDAFNAILARLPKDREKDVILFNPFDQDYAVGVNPYQCRNPKDDTERSRTVSYVLQIFAKLFTKSGDLSETPQMAQVLRNTALTLIANPGMTMAEIPVLLQNEDARGKMVRNVTNPQVQLFWERYNRMKLSEQQEFTASTSNKLDAFLTNELIHYIVGQSITTLDFRQIMDSGKILLVHLDTTLGDLTNLIGSVIVGQFLNAALSRKDIPEDQRRQFNLYADEFQHFATPDFATLLAEARKYGVGTHIFHQNLEQLDEKNRAAALNAPNSAFFTVSGKNAQELKYEREAKPKLGELRYEQIYEPEIITRFQEVVTWDTPNAEQAYNQVVQQLAALEQRDYSEELLLMILQNVFDIKITDDGVEKGVTTSGNSLPYHIGQLCHPDISDIEISSCQQVITKQSHYIDDILTRIHTLTVQIEEVKEKLRQKGYGQQLGETRLVNGNIIVTFYDIDIPDWIEGTSRWDRFKRGLSQDTVLLFQELRQLENQLDRAIRQTEQDVPVSYSIPSSILSPVEKRLQSLLQENKETADLFATIKGAFFPTLYRQYPIAGDVSQPKNFFDRFADIIPEGLRRFTHPDETEYESERVWRSEPLTDYEQKQVTSYLLHLSFRLSHFLNNTSREYIFIPQQGIAAEIYSIIGMGYTIVERAAEEQWLDNGRGYTAIERTGGKQWFYDRDPLPLKKELQTIRRMASLYHAQSDRLGRSHIYSEMHKGYWYIANYPEVEAFVLEESEQLRRRLLEKQRLYEEQKRVLEQQRSELLTHRKVTQEPVTEYKSLKLNTGEVVSPFYKQKYEKELKVSIGFSEGESFGDRSSSRSSGKSISISEEKINLYRGKPGDDEPISNAQDRIAEELKKQPQFTARVKIASADGTPVEHMITILKPQSELVDSVGLQERIARIKKQNIQEGYYREKAVVKAEIAARQEELTKPLERKGKIRTEDRGKEDQLEKLNKLKAALGEGDYNLLIKKINQQQLKELLDKDVDLIKVALDEGRAAGSSIEELIKRLLG